jgi:stage III sporulation protein AH
MLKIIKKNQLTILVISLMLVTAGYLNYNENLQTSSEIADIGDATLVSSNISNSTINQISETNKNEVASSISTNKESVQTNSEVSSSKEYFSSSRLERDTMYSQMLESYQKILDSTTTSEKQKSTAQEEINKINKTKNAIMISENLIKTKGFEDVIIFQNDDSISVVINKEQLNKEDIAQVQSIIAREMGAKIEDIHIMNK